MTEDSMEQGSERFGGTGVWLIRSVIAVNFVRFALSFSARFEGTAGSVGVADWLFQMRWAGFRIDFIWLVISTIVVFYAMFYFLSSRKNNSLAKIDALACLAWVVAFVLDIVRSFLTGVIDFG
jgi:hypothetical protein